MVLKNSSDSLSQDLSKPSWGEGSRTNLIIPDSRQITEHKLWVNSGTGQLKAEALIWEQASEAKKTRTRGHKCFLVSSTMYLNLLKCKLSDKSISEVYKKIVSLIYKARKVGLSDFGLDTYSKYIVKWAMKFLQLLHLKFVYISYQLSHKMEANLKKCTFLLHFSCLSLAA